MASKRSWLRRARSAISEMLALETGANRRLLAKRANPGFTSGHASKLMPGKV